MRLSMSLIGSLFMPMPTALAHPFMHRFHAARGHIADFDSMGLQRRHNRLIVRCLHNGDATIGHFDLGTDFVINGKQPIQRW